MTGRPVVLVHKGDRTRARIGRRVRVGGDVELMIGGNHRIDWVAAFALREVFGLTGAYEDNPWSAGDIEIGDDVIIGRGARVLSGVSVGAGAVVLPYSVVTRDVAARTIVGGHPAQPVGHTSPARGEEQLVGSSTDRAAPVIQRGRRVSARLLRRTADRLDGGRIGPFPAIVDPPVDPPPVEAGTASYFLPIVRCAPGITAKVTIGNYSSVSYECECLFSGLDPQMLGLAGTSPVSSALPDNGQRHQEITFGSDVWVTRGSRVLAGVHIGDGAVVAAYSVVTDDVRPFAIVAGNPAREIARRFDDETVDALLRIRWWEWPESEVLSRAGELCSSDVGAFVRSYDPLRAQPEHPA